MIKSLRALLWTFICWPAAWGRYWEDWGDCKRKQSLKYIGNGQEDLSKAAKISVLSKRPLQKTFSHWSRQKNVMVIRNQMITIHWFPSSRRNYCKVYYHFKGMPHLSSYFLCPRYVCPLCELRDSGMLVSPTSTSKLVNSTHSSLQDVNVLWNTGHQPWLTTTLATCSI